LRDDEAPHGWSWKKHSRTSVLETAIGNLLVSLKNAVGNKRKTKRVRN